MIQLHTALNLMVVELQIRSSYQQFRSFCDELGYPHHYILSANTIKKVWILTANPRFPSESPNQH